MRDYAFMILREYLPNNFPPFRITPCWNLWATGCNMCVQITRPHFLSKKKYTTTLNCYTFSFSFSFLIQQNCYTLLCTNIQKKHTQILKKHITKMNLFLQTNKLLTDVFISSKSVYYKAQ